MYDGRRFFYADFMVHLSIEKALKAVYTKKFNEIPPKSHNLIYFIEKNNMDLTENQRKFMLELNNISVSTRYPEELSNLETIFTGRKTYDILVKGKELLEWIKTQL